MRALVIPALLLAIAGCGAENKEKPPLEVLIRVEGDPGKPIKGADILFNGKSIKKTDDEGNAQLMLTGNEGDIYDVTVKCPAGHQSPTKPISIPLRRLAEGSKTPEYEVSCPPTTRTIVIAVRAENGVNLPVMYLGREVARTDTSGAATVLLENQDADSQFELKLDTSEKGNEQLRPQNPVNVYTIKRADDVFTFDQKFTIEKKAAVWHPTIKKTGPVALPTKVNNY